MKMVVRSKAWFCAVGMARDASKHHDVKSCQCSSADLPLKAFSYTAYGTFSALLDCKSPHIRIAVL